MLFQNLLLFRNFKKFTFCQDGYLKSAELLDYSQNYQGENEELLYFSWLLWKLHRCSSYTFACKLWFLLIVQKMLLYTAGILVYLINPWKILMCWKQWSFIHSTFDFSFFSSSLSWWAFLLCLFVLTCVSQRPNICFLQSLTCRIWFFFHLMEVSPQFVLEPSTFFGSASHACTSIGLSHSRVHGGCQRVRSSMSK